MAKETKVFWVAKNYDPEHEMDDFLHDEIQNSILDYLEENKGINSETVDMIELTEEEYDGFDPLEENELIFVYGPLPVTQHPKNRCFIPNRISFDVMFVYDSGTTVLDHEHPDGWKLRTMNDEEVEEFVNNI